LKNKLLLLVVLLIGTFAGVAHNRYRKGQDIWTMGSLAYTLVAAILTVLLLEALHLLPWQ
jgi:hypothetical protein